MYESLFRYLCPVDRCRAALADIRPATYDLAAVRDSTTLESRVVQDWKPAPNDSSIRQMLVEITVLEWWPGPKGEETTPIESCSIITTDANKLASKVHDRMPVILDADDYDTWLDPANDNTAKLEKLVLA